MIVLSSFHQCLRLTRCWPQLGIYKVLSLTLPPHPQKARAWVVSPEPLNTALASADGNPNAPSITNIGCPAFSGGEEKFVECLLVRSHPAVLAWLQEVALDGPAYKNPVIVSQYEDAVLPSMPEPNWSQWEGPLDFGTVDPRVDIDNEVTEASESKGKSVDSDSEDDA